MNNSQHNRIGQYVIDFNVEWGQGQYGRVFLCRHRLTNEKYAIKIILKSTSKLFVTKYSTISIFLRLSSQKFKHTVAYHTRTSFIEHYQTPQKYYIVLELCEQGTLKHALKYTGKATQIEAIRCIQNVAMAYSELLRKGIIHRDLKPDNLLLKGQQVKLSDFGLAKKVLTQKQLHHSYVGTAMYMAPQILFGQKYNSKCDVWSLGVILYELIYGAHPFIASTEGQLIKKISIIKQKPLILPEEPIISRQTKSFLHQTIVIDEQSRLSWTQVFSHQIFQDKLISIADQWKYTYSNANILLKRIANGVCLELLIGIFFRFQSPTLDYQQFSTLIQTLLKEQVTMDEIPIMYQSFDKDFNGVIDIEQFVCGLVQCDRRIPRMIHQLLEKGEKLQSLKNKQDFFSKAHKLKDYSEQLIEKVYLIISKIIFE